MGKNNFLFGVCGILKFIFSPIKKISITGFDEGFPFGTKMAFEILRREMSIIDIFHD